MTALVLFMLGIAAFLFVQGTKLTNEFKENLEFTVIIKDNTSEKIIIDLEKKLQEQPWVKSADYISKQQAAKIFMQDNEENFKDLLSYNPLFASINLKLNADYTSQDSIDVIENRVMSNPAAGEFYYERKLVSVINDHLRKIGWIMSAISLLFLIIAISLIDGTIRLSMFSNRFLIRSMQLVGATRSFVTWPFIKRSLIDGFIASVVAILALLSVLNFSLKQIPDLNVLNDIKVTFGVLAGIMVAGLLFSLISTRFAIGKYLRMNLDELY
ncbi:MAG: cell division protein FtsX [Chitinophagales bacterium]|nr:cell division protein FtsX [Chitinophagales bacterium]